MSTLALNHETVGGRANGGAGASGPGGVQRRSLWPYPSLLTLT
jgi:hypothetical protein